MVQGDPRGRHPHLPGDAALKHGYNPIMYLVDGNNVMGQRVGWHRDKPGAQRRLLRDLSHLSKRDPQGVRVVFDGRAIEGIVDGGVFDGVQVYFARPGSDADARIVELAQTAFERHRIIAVTSDRQLAEGLDQIGVKTMRSGRFRQLLDERSKQAGE